MTNVLQNWKVHGSSWNLKKILLLHVWFLGHKCRAKLGSEGSPKTKDLRQGNSQIQPCILFANISHLRDLPILKQENPKSALGLFFSLSTLGPIHYFHTIFFMMPWCVMGIIKMFGHLQTHLGPENEGSGKKRSRQ